ncbi:MAG TPA: MarR family transcriptional regulator [Candidatus Eisenbacteria bacterium]|nr:MarR family transcriptional regulator [Candidatus Eisenbacteria bacterium]
MGPNISTEPTPDTRRALDGLRALVQALRESSRSAERSMGLSGAQLFVLQKLGESPAISLNELARRTHTHQSSVSVVVTRLVRRGLVQRLRSLADARALELSLTARGRSLLRRAPGAAQDRLIAAIEALGASRRRLLASALDDVAGTLAVPAEPPAMFFEEPAGRRGADKARPTVGRKARR